MVIVVIVKVVMVVMAVVPNNTVPARAARQHAALFLLCIFLLLRRRVGGVVVLVAALTPSLVFSPASALTSALTPAPAVTPAGVSPLSPLLQHQELLHVLCVLFPLVFQARLSQLSRRRSLCVCVRWRWGMWFVGVKVVVSVVVMVAVNQEMLIKLLNLQTTVCTYFHTIRVSSVHLVWGLCLCVWVGGEGKK
jgi:hypothetical protein